MFNVTGDKARARYQAAILRNMVRLERSLGAKMTRRLVVQFKDAARLVAAGTFNVDIVVDRQRVHMLSILMKHYRRTASIFSTMVFKWWRKLEQRGLSEDFWMGFDRWSSQQAASKVTKINATTRRHLARTISKGIEEGKSPGEIAKDIRTKSRGLNKSRARRIARTETHTAMTYSMDEAVGATRMPFEREWVATKDERTRFGHILADGQRRSQGVAFTVGGEKLMRPGDPSGSAGNIIFCRCVLLYHLTEEGVQAPIDSSPVDISLPSQISVPDNEIIAQMDTKTFGDEYLKTIDLESTDAMVSARRKTEETRKAFKAAQKAFKASPDSKALESVMRTTGKASAEAKDAVRQIRKRFNKTIGSEGPAGELIRRVSVGKAKVDIPVTYGDKIKPRAKRSVEKARELFESMGHTYNEGKASLTVARSSDLRAGYKRTPRILEVSDISKEVEVIHEFGHHLELQSRKVGNEARAFLAKRTKGETARGLSELKGKTYSSREIAKKDKFIDPYMGKIYDTGETEIVSMGMEWMVKDPAQLARRDREYFDFMIRIMRME